MKSRKKALTFLWTLIFVAIMLSKMCVGIAEQELESIQTHEMNDVQTIEPEIDEYDSSDEWESTPPEDQINESDEEPATEPPVEENSSTEPDNTQSEDPSLIDDNDDVIEDIVLPDDTPVNVEYTITFLNPDDSVCFVMKLQEGTAILKPATDPSLDGLVFQYWYDVNQGESVPFSFGIGATEDLTVKAFFALPEDESEPETGDSLEPEEEEEQHHDDPVSEDNSQMVSSDDERSDLSLANVNIWMDINDKTQYGDTIMVYCDIENIFGWEYLIQWQCKDVYGTWEDVPGANSMSHSFTLTESTLETEWRVKVDIIVPDGNSVD